MSELERKDSEKQRYWEMMGKGFIGITRKEECNQEVSCKKLMQLVDGGWRV